MQSINLSDKKLKLLPFVIKRYEKDIDLYIFYNAKNKLFWETDFTTGSVVCALDGSLETEEILKYFQKTVIPHWKKYLIIFLRYLFL